MISLENLAFLIIFYYNLSMKVINLAKRFNHSLKRLLFTTSVHVQSKIICNPAKSLFGSKVFRNDFSEIDGFDNIRNPKNTFFESQKLAAEIYGSKKSFYLYNGSTSGILAAMLSSLKDGDKVLLPRNVHISVIQGLILSGAIPVWFMPEIEERWNLFSGVRGDDISDLLKQHRDIKALVLTSPTYEGKKSDIADIANLCHEHGVVLIVDEAHGALWNFSPELPFTAVEEGADVSVQSLHKNASALNQGAILHLSHHSLVEEEKIQQSLNLINTTSPSFPILASVEGAVSFLNSSKGRKKLSSVVEEAFALEEKLAALEGVEVFKNDDVTKMFVGVKGLSGYALSEILFEKFRIEDELCNSKGALFIFGSGTEKNKFERLYRAFKSISSKNYSAEEPSFQGEYLLPAMKLAPRKAFFSKGRKLKPEDAEGFISKETVTFYPPGIAVLVPGERISIEHIRMIEKDYIEVVDE